jgi:hypothetical protein
LALAIFLWGGGGLLFGCFDRTIAAALPQVSITISPASNVLELNQAAGYDGSFDISNTGARAFDFELSASQYAVDEGHPLEAAYLQIVDWISFDRAVYHLASGEAVTVPYHVKVPENAPSGGQYAIILATARAADEQGALDTTQQVGLLIHARVNGENLYEAGQITAQELATSPVQAQAAVKNTGNVDFVARFNLETETLFGKTVSSQAEQCVILPNAECAVNMAWEKAPVIGVFRVRQEVSFLNDSSSITKTVIILPAFAVWIFGLMVAVLAAAVGMIIRRKRQKKSKRRRHG